jgi:hypothetical protein
LIDVVGDPIPGDVGIIEEVREDGWIVIRWQGVGRWFTSLGDVISSIEGREWVLTDGWCREIQIPTKRVNDL